MKNILITGLGIGKNLGVCETANINYIELLINPSVLLWADKVCIPAEDCYFDSIIDKECKLVFNILESEGIIKRYSCSNVDEDSQNNIYAQAEKDIIELANDNPNAVITSDTRLEEVNTFDTGYKYCIPKIASIYASILVANEINAICLFDSAEEAFIKSRFLNSKSILQTDSLTDVYKEVLSFKLPNESILHEYGRHNCGSCKQNKHCSDSYLSEVEDRLIDILSLRNTDEMVQLRAVIDDIVNARDRLLQPVGPDEIIHDLNYRKMYLQKSLDSQCKKAKRIANIGMSISIPISIMSLVLGRNDISLAASTTMGVATVIEKLADYYESKNSWVHFIDKENHGRC